MRQSEDLLIGIINAADPVRYNKKISQFRNHRLQGDNKFVKFMADKPSLYSNTVSRSDFDNVAIIRADSKEKAYQQFQQVVVHDFVEHMFTGNSEDIYGKGTAGQIWKSMTADAISEHMVKSNSLGLNKVIEKNIYKNPNTEINNDR